jgi:site-specific DNA recombinase
MRSQYSFTTSALTDGSFYGSQYAAMAPLFEHYGVADAGPHPNKAHATWGRRAHRLARHSVARIARALNEAGVPCPSAADPGRNSHRNGTAWTLGAVTAILENPRYTGKQVWNRQRTDTDLVDPPT